MDIGERIVLLRERKGWKQKDFADKVKINVSVMNRIEKGSRPLTDVEIIKIADALEVTTDHLLKGESNISKVERILEDSNTQIAANDGNISREDALKAIEWLLETEKGRKPGDKQFKK
ncbi:transcriptional regulator with XRE-family HTH domain [Metabacillus crassostreae]|uniref:helix-turn-helix domain-containing protein n=1 Tax=Metabacillus crassostreae TaxID=929098 RepID=UPI00195D7882|nr:helix-turn-helix transcriptional regulator [Metabacillus crassostreae]MBM7606023.1 transcriptional regulator with XRE-family HTH domain [Metabacillus crassostreae]